MVMASGKDKKIKSRKILLHCVPLKKVTGLVREEKKVLERDGWIKHETLLNINSCRGTTNLIYKYFMPIILVSMCN
jgi:hypothetical protein